MAARIEREINGKQGSESSFLQIADFELGLISPDVCRRGRYVKEHNCLL